MRIAAVVAGLAFMLFLALPGYLAGQIAVAALGGAGALCAFGGLWILAPRARADEDEGDARIGAYRPREAEARAREHEKRADEDIADGIVSVALVSVLLLGGAIGSVFISAFILLGDSGFSG